MFLQPYSLSCYTFSGHSFYKPVFFSENRTDISVRPPKNEPDFQLPGITSSEFLLYRNR